MGSRNKALIALAGVVVTLGALALSIQSQLCVRAFLRHRVVVPVCPDGDVVPGLHVSAPSLRRGQEGDISVGAFLRYARPGRESQEAAPLRRFDVTLALVQRDDVRPLQPIEGWVRQPDHRQRGRFLLPADLPDGEYALRANVTTASGEVVTLDAPLKLYAPARVHLLTDRPLYEPGNTIRFRAVVLRARDLAPLDGRPGRFVVEDPMGEVVLEEDAPAGAFGIAAGELPLDEDAPIGMWTVRWESAGASEQVGVRVEPFTLPRFVVEAAPVKGHYLPGERPVLRGRVLYSSGAPVSADIALSWSLFGDWPPPDIWQPDALPTTATTGQGGWFEVTLPEVPADLRGKVTAGVTVSATDPAGDRAVAQGAVLLSEHAIDVEAVTELDGGLVEGFNNRVYLRATSAGGDVLANVTLEIARAWDPTHEPVVVETDADGVAALQLDPGRAVHIVIPPMPVRAPKRPDPVERTHVRERIAEGEPRLADVREMDRWNAAIAPCARFVLEEDTVEVTTRVEPTGAVSGVLAEGPAAQCVASVLRQRRLPAGRSRLYEIGYRLRADLARIEHSAGGTSRLAHEVETALRVALLDARTCLPDDVPAAGLPRMVLWRVEGGRFSTTSEADPDVGVAVAAAQARCVEGKLAAALAPRALSKGASPDDEAHRDAFGWLRFTVEPAPRVLARRPQPTTMMGYELAIRARADDEDIGRTVLRLRPGSVPPLRLRATPALPPAGGEVTVEVLRGPGFSGELPKELSLVHEQRTLKTALDDKPRTARFTLPAELSGWFSVTLQGARAQVYVRPASELSVEVVPDKAAHAPGATARLDVVTTSAGVGTRAAVGLFGVDETLAVLAPLPGPDAMASLRPSASMSRVAFGVLHANALVQGRIRGENAAAATVLLVSSLPALDEIDSFTSVEHMTPFDPNERLTGSFYTVLEELHAIVRRWEKDAPADERMTPQRMASSWEEALAACAAKGADVRDAFGRPLTLSRLPPDLLSLLEPRAVVVEGTRLPEDIESWPEWVRRSQP